MALREIQPRYFEVLKIRYGSHTEVARRLGISRNWYQRIRNNPAKHVPSVALRNAITVLVNAINLEDELLRRS